jgi:uncharacterized protein with NAD-binding domain and iron-sulfur cluster
MRNKVLKKLDQYGYAEKMIRHNMRPPLVWTNFPSLNIRCLYDLWRKIHNRPVPTGLLPFSVRSYIRSPLDCVQAHYFLRLYKAESSKDVSKVIDVPTLISAYETFVAIVPDNNISLSAAWYIARDYRIQILHEKKCGECQLDYLFHDQCNCNLEAKALQVCPFCWAKKTTQRKQVRRARHDEVLN